MTVSHENMMRRALDLAEKGLGRTSPNPPVGAIVVSKGQVVGEGFHPKAGEPHAEVFALRDAGDLARGAEMYVTLEPCCHLGRTGPCVDAILSACISTVYVGTLDPNPKVSGGGVERLRQAGVEVVTGVLEAECRQLIAPFAKYITTGLPYVVFKAAMTLDGHVATSNGDSNWISCEASRELVHKLRDQVDGIMVGSGTVTADNPKLTTRLDEGGRDPLRIVFDGCLTTSPEATVYTQSSEAQTLLVTSSVHTDVELHAYRATGSGVLQVENADEGSLDLREALKALGGRGLQYLLLEGGSKFGGAMLRAGLVDKVMIFVAPKIIGGEGLNLLSGEGASRISDAYDLKNLRARQVDVDILLEGEVQHVYRAD